MLPEPFLPDPGLLDSGGRLLFPGLDSNLLLRPKIQTSLLRFHTFPKFLPLKCLILFPWFIAEEEFWSTRIIAGLAVCAVAILQLKTLQIGSSQEYHKVKTQSEIPPTIFLCRCLFCLDILSCLNRIIFLVPNRRHFTCKPSTVHLTEFGQGYQNFAHLCGRLKLTQS